MTRTRTLMSAAATLLAAPAFLMAAPALAGPAYPQHNPSLEPSNPTVGQCYARVKIPAQYETGVETVIKREAHTRVQVQQAELASRTQDILVKEPSVRYVVRQPRYTTITEQLVTRPAYDKLTVTPPQFQTVTETLQTSAPRLVWKLGNPGHLAAQGYKIHSTADAGHQGQGYSSTTQFGQMGGERCGSMCEIWCLVEEPGDTVTVSRQVMSAPGDVRRTRVPHQTQTIRKQIVADPGGVDEVPVPGEFQTVTVQDVVRPAGEAVIEVPAEYGQVSTKRLIQDERYEWRQVVCAPGTAVGGVSHSAATSHNGTVSNGYSGSTHSSSTHSGAGAYQGAYQGTLQGSTITSAPAATYGTTSSYGGTTIHSSGPTVTERGYYGVDDTDSAFGSTSFPSPTYEGPAYSSGLANGQTVVRHAPKRMRD